MTLGIQRIRQFEITALNMESAANQALEDGFRQARIAEALGLIALHDNLSDVATADTVKWYGQMSDAMLSMLRTRQASI